MFSEGSQISQLGQRPLFRYFHQRRFVFQRKVIPIVFCILGAKNLFTWTNSINFQVPDSAAVRGLNEGNNLFTYLPNINFQASKCILSETDIYNRSWQLWTGRTKSMPQRWRTRQCICRSLRSRQALFLVASCSVNLKPKGMRMQWRLTQWFLNLTCMHVRGQSTTLPLQHFFAQTRRWPDKSSAARCLMSDWIQLLMGRIGKFTQGLRQFRSHQIFGPSLQSETNCLHWNRGLTPTHQSCVQKTVFLAKCLERRDTLDTSGCWIGDTSGEFSSADVKIPAHPETSRLGIHLSVVSFLDDQSHSIRLVKFSVAMHIPITWKAMFTMRKQVKPFHESGDIEGLRFECCLQIPLQESQIKPPLKRQEGGDGANGSVYWDSASVGSYIAKNTANGAPWISIFSTNFGA